MPTDHLTEKSYSPARAVRPGRPSVKTTFQLAVDVVGDEENAALIHGEVRSIALAWLNEKFPEDLPESAGAGETFEIDHHGQSVHCISLPEETVWSVRLVQPDAPFRDRHAVPGRTWTTEISLTTPTDTVRLGIRVLCASLEYADEPIALTRPRVVVDIANRFVLKEAAPLLGEAWRPDSVNELKALFDLLEDPARSLPIYMLTEADERYVGESVAEFLLNHEYLARKLQGLAYVVTMPKKRTFDWTDAVDRPWSAFQGAVRTYNPGLDFDADAVTDHPLAFAHKVLAFRYRGETGVTAFEKFLVDRAQAHSANRRVDWEGCIFYADARRLRAEIAKETARDDDEWKSLYEEEIWALTQKLEEQTDEAQTYYGFAVTAEQERDRLADENRRLRSRLDALRRAPTSSSSGPAAEPTSLPDDYDSLPTWVEEELVGRLVLHARALKGLKKPAYSDVERVYESLLLLATEYRDMKMGVKGAKTRFHEKREELRLLLSPSISEEKAGEEGDTYFVPYPHGSASRRFLKCHLRSRANTRDPARCLRIYFFWDDEDQQVVVGWLPSHLVNRMT